MYKRQAVYFGDGATFSDYKLIFSGVIDEIDFSYSRSGSGDIVLTVRSLKKLFDKSIQTNAYQGTNSGSTGNEGESDSSIVNQLKPLCFGEVKNITPVLVNYAGLRYQVHDGEIENVTAVYANGAALVEDVSNPPAAGKYYVDKTLGIITLGTAPAGELITCDVKGAKLGSPATYYNKASDIIIAVLRSYYGMSDSEIDTASFDTLATNAPYVVGVYLSEITAPDKEQNATLTYTSIFDKLLDSIGSFWTFNNQNKFTVGQFDVPDNVSPIVSFNEDEIIDISLIKNSDENRGVPLATLDLHGEFNFTVQASGLAGSVIASRIEWLKNQTRKVSKFNSNNGIIYNADIAVISRDTFITNISDVDTEAARLMVIYETSRKFFRVVFDQTVLPTNLDINTVITLVFPRFNLTNGKKFLVMGIKNNYPEINQAELELYG